MRFIIFIIAALASAASVAQEHITVQIIVSLDGSLLSSTVNENAEWSVFVEHLSKPVTDTTFVPLESGSTVIDYYTEEKGIHHLLLTDMETGDALAYVILCLDYSTMRGRNYWELLITEQNDKYATFAPTRHNKVESILGLVPGLQD